MSLDQTKKVDIIIGEKDGKKGLLISDHYEWENDDLKHLYMLQEKINAYLNAAESGQLTDYCPNANKGYRIRLCCKYPVNKEGEAFILRLKGFLKEHGYDFELVYAQIGIKDSSI